MVMPTVVTGLVVFTRTSAILLMKQDRMLRFSVHLLQEGMTPKEFC